MSGIMGDGHPAENMSVNVRRKELVIETLFNRQFQDMISIPR